jgi:hypothetical protein
MVEDWTPLRMLRLLNTVILGVLPDGTIVRITGEERARIWREYPDLGFPRLNPHFVQVRDMEEAAQYR